MNLPNYQLIKEADKYYLAKKRIMYNFVNVKSLCSALDELNQWKTPGSTKNFSPTSATKSDADNVENRDVKEGRESRVAALGCPGKALSPLVMSNKERLDRMFDLGNDGNSVGRCSPLTVRSDTVAIETGHRKVSLEKRLTTDSISLEGVSLLNRRRSKDLVLKMKAPTDEESSGPKRKSSEPDNDSPRSLTNASAEVDSSFTDGELNKGESVSMPNTPSAVSVAVMSDVPVCDSPFSTTSSGGHFTSAVQSPVVSDVSIHLTKTDGRCEPFRISPERTHVTDDHKVMNDSFDSIDETNSKNEAILKRCSSFAGFKSDISCQNIKVR